MTMDRPDQRVAELLVVLDRLTSLHHDLLRLIRRKTELMRSGDTDGLHTEAAREASLVETIRAQEGLRRQLMDAIGRGLGLNSQVARRLPVRQLAERLTESMRPALLSASERLRSVVRETAEANRLAALIAAQVLQHLRCIFEAVASPDQQPDTYSPRGQVVTGHGRRLFEMTG
ncbi:MAG: flagellar protein FlgN [bacterium]|nr:flagellar protein FlgN [bacterium]